MKRLIIPAALTLFVLSAGAQTQPAVQGSASASSTTTVNAEKSGAQAATSSSASASAQAGRDSASLTGGSAMQAELTHPVDCKKNKPGDTVTAKTTEASTADGQVAIPKGSKLVGHVTEAREHQKPKKGQEGHDSALGIAWDKAVLKNGQEVPLNASIQAIARAQGQASSAVSEPEMPMGGSAMAGGSAGGRGALGGVGGATSNVGGAVSGATHTVGSVGSTAGGAVNSTTNVAGSATGSVSGAASGTVGGLNAAGQFASNSRGVFGLNGLQLTSAVSGNAEASLITSPTQNVHLDSGTRMLLMAQGQAQAQASSQHAPRSSSPAHSERQNDRR